MLKKLKSSLVFICLISLLTGCVNQNQEVTSDQEITVAATSIAVTEILDQLNIPAKQVVGIPQSDSYTVPKKYQKTTKIGNAMTPDMEKISTLKPDLILSPNSLESDLSSKYEKIKISSSFLNLKNLSGMYKSIEELGKLFNKENSWYKPKHNNIPFNEVSFLDGVGSILLGKGKIQNDYDVATLITFMDSCEYFKMDNLPELVVYYKRLLSQPNYLKAYDEFFNGLDQDMINSITSNQTKHSFEINADIKNFILKDMPSDLTKLEKAIYIYSKLCKILDYDMEYYNDNANKKFIAEESISDVDLSNNNVVCYTFSYIYSGLLREIGIDQIKEAKINKGEFVNKHASVEFVVDNIVIMADSTHAGAEIGDLTTLKVENKINGLRCSQFNIEKQNKVNQAKKKVEMILEKEKTDEETNYFLPSQEKLDSMTSIDKYILFNDLVAATPLTGVSLLGYIQVLKDRLNLYIITKVEKDLDQNDLIINIKMRPLGVEKTYFENAAISYKINARNKEIIYNGSNFVNGLSNHSVPSSRRQL